MFLPRGALRHTNPRFFLMQAQYRDNLSEGLRSDLPLQKGELRESAASSEPQML